MRLLVLVGVVATVAVASVAFLNIVRNRELTREVAEASAADRYFLANEQVRDLIVARVLESLYLTADSPTADQVASRDELARLVSRLGDNTKALAAIRLTGPLAAAGRVDAEVAPFASRAAAMLDLIYSSQRSQARAELPEFLAASDAIDRQSVALPFRVEVNRLNDRAGAAQNRALLWVGLATLLAVVALILGAQWVVSRIRTALRRMSDAAGRMAGGDLATRVVHDADDEVGGLADSFNALASTLATTFERLESDARRESFNTKLAEALDMVDTETEVHDALSLALEQAGPYASEILLSDSSRANLERCASHPNNGAPGCPVGSPYQCAAVRRGNPVVFESSRELNACPKLRGRPTGEVSAVCVPVSFMGRSVGVLHATGPDGEPPSADVVVRLGQIATLAGARIGTVRAFQQPQLQAATDALTGLANRRTIEAQVRELFIEGRLFTFVMADLDFFKRVNDSHGHEMGDRALRLFSRVFTDGLRAGDLAARWGGEEFAAVLHGVRAADATRVLERLRNSLAQATMTGETPPFTASFGIIDSATVGNFELLVRTADDALYAAKEAGRDCVVVGDPTIIGSGGRRFAPEHDSRIDTRALLADDRQ